MVPITPGTVRSSTSSGSSLQKLMSRRFAHPSKRAISSRTDISPPPAHVRPTSRGYPTGERPAPGIGILRTVVDPFVLLELPPAATLADARDAYRRLARRAHPDHNPGVPDAAARFAALHRAYEAAVAEIEGG